MQALVGRMVWLPEHYQRPGWFTTNVFNRLVAALTRVGVQRVRLPRARAQGPQVGRMAADPGEPLRITTAPTTSSRRAVTRNG